MLEDVRPPHARPWRARAGAQASPARGGHSSRPMAISLCSRDLQVFGSLVLGILGRAGTRRWWWWWWSCHDGAGIPDLGSRHHHGKTTTTTTTSACRPSPVCPEPKNQRPEGPWSISLWPWAARSGHPSPARPGRPPWPSRGVHEEGGRLQASALSSPSWAAVERAIPAPPKRREARNKEPGAPDGTRFFSRQRALKRLNTRSDTGPRLSAPTLAERLAPEIATCIHVYI